jgi:7-cyano-7-deazaguanine synthase in queuosine biosynthesis
MSSVADGKRPEHRICCGVAGGKGDPPEQLGFTVDGVPRGVRLRIGQLTDKLASNLSDAATDLIEIAAYVYAADAAISRGGPADAQMGARWRRDFAFEIPVRCPELWSERAMLEELSRTLSFVSDDAYRFSFEQHPHPEPIGRYFDLVTEVRGNAEAVVLFSGGLDSFAGALEELIDRRHRVALVSHWSSTKLRRVQTDLVRELAKRISRPSLFHVPVTAQLAAGTNREGSHRTRSFLFASLAAVVARAFGRDRVTFYENGIVSLNLPPAAQVVGARATRSTHPQSLEGFGRLFSRVFQERIRVDNPSFWRTKKEVVEQIARLGFADLIRHTRSCADVHNLTRMHPHCGRCSQCIDRYIALRAAGLETFDPAEAYAVHPLLGPRRDVRDREIALGYIRNAEWFRAAPEAQFLQQFGEASRAITHLGERPELAMRRIVDLHRRHGQAVAQAIEIARVAAFGSRSGEPDRESPLGLLGAETLARLGEPTPAFARSIDPAFPDRPPWEICIDRERKIATLAGQGSIKGANYQTLVGLADAHLRALGEGIAPQDSPTMT